MIDFANPLPVFIASKPQLVHTNSKLSVTASDDYYSLTDSSSNDERTTGPTYEAPPMHMQPTIQEALQSAATISPIKSLEDKELGEPEKQEIGPPEGHKIKRKPVSSSSSSSGGTIIRRPMSTVSPPTPGVDDTPYIQFAIDQLTRDEEVAGSRHHSRREEPYYNPERRIPKQGRGVAKAPPLPPPIPPKNEMRQSPIDNVLLPTDPVTEASTYPRLHYVPAPLRIIPLGVLIFCCILMLAALAFCGAYPLHHNGLYQYDGTGTRRYFVFQYLPQILASIIVIWLFVIQAALHRIYPFLALASGHGSGNSAVLFDTQLFATTYLIPQISYLRKGGLWLAGWAMAFWLTLFTVPLQSCLFQTRYFAEDGTWRWTSVRAIAWVLFVLYLILTISLSTLICRFAFVETGLKWDPTSLADIISIFHRSNILNDFQRSEIEETVRRPAKDLRLGYWRRAQHGEDTFYCVADENLPVSRYSLERGKMRPVNSERHLDLEAQYSSRSGHDSFKVDIHNPSLRYRWVPWFLKDTFVVAWIVIAIVLLAAFLVLSFVNNAVEIGFVPKLPSPTSAGGFSPADFLYSFVPSLLGMILFLVWQPIDHYFRAMQAFASMADRDGSTAEESLLLDYNARLPMEVSICALVNGHFKVAWISFIGIMSITLPVLAGGIFTAQFVRSLQDVRTEASLPGFEALVAFLVIYAFSFLAIFPTRKRHLPHDISTLGDLVSFFYKSPLLAEGTFREPKSKIDLVTKLMSSTTAEEKHNSHYAFGIYMGLDGREHLGIDRLERPGYGEMLVEF